MRLRAIERITTELRGLPAARVAKKAVDSILAEEAPADFRPTPRREPVSTPRRESVSTAPAPAPAPAPEASPASATTPAVPDLRQRADVLSACLKRLVSGNPGLLELLTDQEKRAAGLRGRAKKAVS